MASRPEHGTRPTPRSPQGPPERVRARGDRERLRTDAAVRALLAELPERQREAIFLRYYADLIYAAIAELLGISADTVAATLNAAHSALRERLERVRR